MAKRNAHTVIKAYVHTYVHIHICSMYIKKSKTASGIVFIYLPLPTDDVEQISQTVPASAAAIRYICDFRGWRWGERTRHTPDRAPPPLFYFFDESRILANKFHYV